MREEHELSEHAKLPAESGAPPAAYSNPWIVRVGDNFNYAEDDEAHTHATYATYEEALAVCKEIVLADLKAASNIGRTPDEIYQNFIDFGEDPFIFGPDAGVERFSGWTFVRQQCDAMRLTGAVTSGDSTQLDAGWKEAQC